MDMIEVVGVRFKRVGKVYYFDPKGQQIPMYAKVIVETVRGLEIGETVIPNRMVEENAKFMPLSPVLRIATEADLMIAEENAEKEKRAFGVCEEKIKKHQLQMKLVDVEYTFDNNKIVFYFVADGRVDFRELVKDLASVFKTRIELRQIGVRDETKIRPCLGICGRRVCCGSFLTEFEPVSVRMAKDQSLSTSPQKISGACGKLICCLNFEESAYEEAYTRIPRVGYTVSTPDGNGTVIEVNVLKEEVRVRLDNRQIPAPKTFPAAEVKILRSEERGAEQVDPDAAALED